MISSNLFGNSQSFFGGQQGYNQRNQRQPQPKTPAPNQFTGSAYNMQYTPSQVNSFPGVSAFSGASSATSTGLQGHQRVDKFGSAGAGVNAFRAQPQPQFGALSGSAGPDNRTNAFKGNPNFQGQSSYDSFKNDIASGQVKFRGDGGAPYTSQSLYVMA